MTKRVSIVSISERIQTPVSKPKGTFFYSLYLSVRFIYKYHVIRDRVEKIRLYVIFGYNWKQHVGRQQVDRDTSTRRDNNKIDQEIKPVENQIELR